MITSRFADCIKSYKELDSLDYLDKPCKRDIVILASVGEVFGIIDMVNRNSDIAIFMLAMSYTCYGYGKNTVFSLEHALLFLTTEFVRLGIFDEDSKFCSYLSSVKGVIESLYKDGYVFIVNPDWERRISTMS